jgi:AraC family transcriptional regulator
MSQYLTAQRLRQREDFDMPTMTAAPQCGSDESRTLDTRMWSSPTTPAVRSPKRSVNIIAEESEWRLRPPGSEAPSSGPRVVATRWRALDNETRETCALAADDCHLVKIVLRCMNVHLSVSGRTVLDGVATPGMFHVTEPAASARCLFRGPYETLHLHVPNELTAECVRDAPGYQEPALYSEPSLTRDPTVERLARALLETEQVGGSFGQLYADCLSIAIVARLLASARRLVTSDRRKVAALAKWRLKRAMEYIEPRLSETVSLADVASAVGLTRMHFAAQFKAAVGLSPHEYHLRRRVERAQEMLLKANMSVVDVALAVGFRTQQHFTSIFTRFVGQPPYAWRQAQDVGIWRKPS